MTKFAENLHHTTCCCM